MASANARRRPVVFLDRDGTMIRDRPGFYLRRPDQVRIYPAAFEALRRLKAAGYRLVVVSNQSGIGRGFLDEAQLARIHRRLRGELRRRGADVDAIYFCPHHPDDGCRCRKPSPILARRALRDLGLTLTGAAVVGDKKADVDLARALGVPSVLVKTGHGRSQRARYGVELKPTHETGNLLSAANWIIGRRRER
jgi:histidinol-phosphate phosphatase family protein